MTCKIIIRNTWYILQVVPWGNCSSFMVSYLRASPTTSYFLTSNTFTSGSSSKYLHLKNSSSSNNFLYLNLKNSTAWNWLIEVIMMESRLYDLSWRCCWAVRPCSGSHLFWRMGRGRMRDWRRAFVSTNDAGDGQKTRLGRLMPANIWRARLLFRHVARKGTQIGNCWRTWFVIFAPKTWFWEWG